MLALFKNLSLRTITVIFLVWTLAALSMTTQIYLNTRLSGAASNWFEVFFKQLPAWYLCAILTPFILYTYKQYPLHHAINGKHYFARHLFIAVCILAIFSNLRLWCMSYAIGRLAWQFTPQMYLHAYFAQVLWDTVVYSLILLAIYALNVTKANKTNLIYAQQTLLDNAELENLLKEAKLETLKLQLSPHFLFNTLNTINSLVRMNDQNAAIKITSKLGDFLRSTLYTENATFVYLAQELEDISIYADIETLRFKGRLNIIKEIDERSLRIEVPHFILQPLLENAIKHGVGKKIDAGFILIRTAVHDNLLKISIYNDGELLSTNKNGQGIGLKNVRSRLTYIYGERSSFSIMNVDNKGVEVNICIAIN